MLMEVTIELMAEQLNLLLDKKTNIIKRDNQNLIIPFLELIIW